MKNLILMGPPGAGKGTQADILCKNFDIMRISTGEILRDALNKKTKLGLEAKFYMDKGNLVPDNVVVSMIKACLINDDCAKGFVLDGFPRTKEQAQALDKILNETDKNINHVLFFRVPDDQLVDRLLKRAKKEGRTDDNMKSIQNRLKVFREKTAPVLDYYKSRNMLQEVIGVGSILDISKNVKEILND